MRAGTSQVHVNAICTKHKIGGGTFPSASEALVWAIDQVDQQSGIAIVNHPNFDHGLRTEDLLAARSAPLLEIMSGHPYVYSEGKRDRPSSEVLWDRALSAGASFMGVGVDDVHHLRASADPPAYPGQAWVQVFTHGNDPTALCAVLRQGLLYSSNGPSLARIRVTDTAYEVWPKTARTVVARSSARTDANSSARVHSKRVVVLPTRSRTRSRSGTCERGSRHRTARKPGRPRSSRRVDPFVVAFSRLGDGDGGGRQRAANRRSRTTRSRTSTRPSRALGTRSCRRLDSRPAGCSRRRRTFLRRSTFR